LPWHISIDLLRGGDYGDGDISVPLFVVRMEYASPPPPKVLADKTAQQRCGLKAGGSYEDNCRIIVVRVTLKLNISANTSVQWALAYQPNITFIKFSTNKVIIVDRSRLENHDCLLNFSTN